MICYSGIFEFESGIFESIHTVEVKRIFTVDVNGGGTWNYGPPHRKRKHTGPDANGWYRPYFVDDFGL